MKRVLALLLVCPLGALWAQTVASLKGTVTDPSGAPVPNALIQLRGPGGEQRAETDISGVYSFASLRPGTYRVRFIAKGFTVDDREKVDVAGAMTLDSQLTIKMQSQVVNVEDEANSVSADPANNGTAIVLGQKEIDTLSDDPDELQEQLQALAGPSAGPNGGQIFIDGFSGGTMPPKASIREVRINSNPFSAEYDRPGFGRIEILTRPGTDTIRGQAFFQFNDESLNSRSPLLTQSKRPPYQQKFFDVNLSGPIVKKKASFSFNIERRNIDENAFVYATTLDANLQPQQVNMAIVTPQVRMSISPRVDYAINDKNTLVFRYHNVQNTSDNAGVGDYNLESKAYTQQSSTHVAQLTETAVLSAKSINELRFQYVHSSMANTGDNTIPALSVAGAFNGGGAQIGNSGNINNHWELNNSTSLIQGRHTMKWGGRLRQSFLDDTSVSNFGGTYTFFGAAGPELDANNSIIPGSIVQLTALERYQRTLYLQSLGMAPAQIRLLGGGASQFSLGAGTPTTSVNQFDMGLFFTDDWRLRSNFTFSYGLRYETQTNISDYKDWSPRVGIAWGIDGGANKAAKTVLRAGFGIFYDRIADSVTLQADRYNGLTQQSYLLINPNFFPSIPTPEELAAAQQPQRLQIMDRALVAPRNYQGSIGVDRQINKYFRLSAQYVMSRGVHVERIRNINTPINGSYPYGDALQRILTETTGFSRTQQLVISPNLNYKKLFLFGYYSYGHGNSDAQGYPADPYNLRAEWGPSSFGDIRHRFVVGTNIPTFWKVSLSPFITGSSGSPYTITTGRDTNFDGFTAERPALLTNLDSSACSGPGLIYKDGFGCFDNNPLPGMAAIGRNSARGPSTFTVNMRVARTWSFGGNGESGPAEGMRSGGHGGPGGMRGGGGGMHGMMGGGPPRGMFGDNTGKRYNITLSAMVRNLLNTSNYAAPSGDLSSPYFGEYRSLAGFGPFGGNSTYNRRIDFQLRFSF